MSVKTHVLIVKTYTLSVHTLNRSRFPGEKLQKETGDLAIAVELLDADARGVLQISPHVRGVVRTRSDAPIKTIRINMGNLIQIGKVSWRPLGVQRISPTPFLRASRLL